MGTKVITPATAESVLPLETLRAACRIDGTADDTLLGIWRSAAIRYAEHYTGRSIGEQVLEHALDAFPAGPILLPNGPVREILSLRYVDPDGAEQTMSAAAYTLDDYSDPQWALAAAGTGWPVTHCSANAVKVRYAAGSNTVDGAALHALLLLVGHADKNREAVTQGAFAEVPLGVRALLDTLVDYSGRG